MAKRRRTGNQAAVPTPTPAEPPASGLLARYKTELSMAIIAALIGLIEATFSPIQVLVKNRVWPERIVVDEVREAVVNQPLAIQVALVNQSTVGGVSAGSVKFVADDNVRIDGRNTFTFPRSDGSITVPTDKEYLTVVPLRAGVATLGVHVKTSRGTHEGHIKLRATATQAIRADDFTGVWRVRFNKGIGTLTLRQNSSKDRHFQGEIRLADEDILTVAPNGGWWDGTSFAFVANGKSGAKYDVQSTFCKIKNDSGEWMVLNGDFIKSVNGRGASLAYDRPVREERCPSPDPPREKSGSFFGAAPLQ